MDFEVGYNIQLGRVNLRPFVGARYADFEQTTLTSGLFIQGFPLRYGVLTPGGFHASWERLVTNTGAGPRLGLEAQVNVGSGFGFAVVVKLSLVIRVSHHLR